MQGRLIDEHIAVWDHLSKAGFINGNYTYVAGAPTAANSPVNPYAGFLVLIYDAVYDSLAPAVSTARHNLKTGTQIPANILAEIDRKIDDGIATTGSFRFSAHTGFTATISPLQPVIPLPRVHGLSSVPLRQTAAPRICFKPG